MLYRKRGREVEGKRERRGEEKRLSMTYGICSLERGSTGIYFILSIDRIDLCETKQS